MKKEKRGGPRTSLTKKIGRPTKETTEVLYIRVPAGCIAAARIAVYEIIKDYELKK